MKPRSERMQRVAQFADKRADEAARRMAEEQQIFANGQAQLDELLRFRNEYAMNFSKGAGIDVHQLLNHRQFLQRLDEAIHYQHTVLERQRQVLEQERVRWYAARSRAKALHTVVQKFQYVEMRILDRHEQAQADEHAQRASTSRGWPEEPKST